MVQKGSLNRHIPVVNFINGDPLLGSPKSKAQTTGRQKPRPCLHFPLAEINYFPYEEEHQFLFTTGRKERFAQKFLKMLKISGPQSLRGGKSHSSH